VLLLFTVPDGCSVYYESKRPEYIDVTSLHVGMERYEVTALLGKPADSYKKDGMEVDVFLIDPNGRYLMTKVAVNTFDVAADVFTLGMWEAVATPAEMLTTHKNTTYMITYNASEKVASIDTLKPGEGGSATPAPGAATDHVPVTAAEADQRTSGPTAWPTPAPPPAPDASNADAPTAAGTAAP